jgi:hypothetical protein
MRAVATARAMAVAFPAPGSVTSRAMAPASMLRAAASIVRQFAAAS